MTMTATHIVTDNSHQTAGFIIDNTYFCYHDVLHNVDFLDNLILVKHNILRPLEGNLPTCSKRESNAGLYEQICDANPLNREVAVNLEQWNQISLYLKNL